MNSNSGTESTDQKLRILLAEDDASVRRSIQLLLRGRGFDVRAYSAADPILLDDSIEEAVCLITDYRLGGRDGIALLTALRAIKWPGTAILITGYPTRELRQSAIDAGFDEFLEKPFHEYALVNAVTRLTRRSADSCG